MPTKGRKNVHFFGNVISTPANAYGISLRTAESLAVALLTQQSWCEIDHICGNLPDPKLFQDLLSVEGAEHLAGGLVAQLLPRIGIDMAHQKINVILGEAVKTRPFGKHPTDHLVRNLAATFLVGTLWIAIKDFRAQLN